MKTDVDRNSAAPPCSPSDVPGSDRPVMDFIVVYGVFDCLCEVTDVEDGFVTGYTVHRLKEDGSKGEIMPVDIEDEVQRRYSEFCECDVD